MRDLKSGKPAKFKQNRRRREKKPRDWRKLFRRVLRVSAFAGSVALVAGGVLLGSRLLLASDFFRLEKVRVNGQQRVSQEEILALSDLRLGTSILDLDLELIGRKIEENPWVATARVERVFPREVAIQVAERTPRAVIDLGYLYYVDGSGEIFKLLDPDDSLDFPVVTGIDRRSLLENPAEGRQRLAEVMALIAELEQRSTFGLKDVSELHVDPEAGLVLYTCSGGVPVRMGHGGFAAKLDRLERIYRELEPRLPVLKYVDLNVTDRVIVKVESRRNQQGQG